MKQQLFSHITGLTILFLLFSPHAFAGGRETDADHLVPADIHSFTWIRDFNSLHRRIQDSPYAELAGEPGMDEFAAGFLTQLREQFEDVGKKLGAAPADFGNFLTGQVAMAVQKADAYGNRGGGTLYLIGTGDENSREIKALLDRIVRHVSDSDTGRVTIDDIAGRKVYIARFFSDRAEPEDAAERVMFSFDGEILAILHAREPDLLEEHLALSGGEKPRTNSIAGLPLYRELRQKVPAGADYMSFKNFELFWKAILGGNGPFSVSEPGFDPEGFFEAMGVFSLKGAISTLSWAGEGVTGEGFCLISEPGKGLWKALNPRKTPDLRPLPFVDADAAFYGAAYFDLPSLWEETVNAMRVHAPELHGSLELSIGSPDGPVKLEEDIIKTLGKRWFLYLPAGAPGAGEDEDVHWLDAVVAVELQQPERLSRAIERLLLMSGMPHAWREHPAGHTVLSLKAVKAADVSAVFHPRIEVAMNIGFVDDLLIITANPHLISELLVKSGRGASPLTAQEGFRDALKRLIPAPSSFAYADLGAAGEMFRHVLTPVFEGLQVTPPDYGSLRPYMPEFAMTSKWEDEGFRYRIRVPYPDPGGD